MLNRLSIAHVTEAFGGGITTYMTLVLPALTERGYKVTLFCCNSRKEPNFADSIETISKAGVQIKLLPMCREIRPWADIHAIIRLHGELKAGNYDLIHTHCAKAGLLGRMAARSAGIPVVHTPHCYPFLRTVAPMSFLSRMAERVLNSSTSGLIAVSESEKQTAIEHNLVNSAKCKVVCNGMPKLNHSSDKTMLRKNFGLPQSSFIVTMAARLVDYKGVSLFLDVAELCQDTNTMFALAGYGELKNWAKKQVASRGLSTQVQLLGHVKDVPSLLEASDVCISCSKAEGQPYTLLEAMRCGCSIVAPDVPGICEMLEHGKTAMLVQRNAKEFVAAIQQLADNESLRNNLATKAKERFGEAHLLEMQVDSLIEAYEYFYRMH